MIELKAFYDLDTEVLDGYSHNSLDNRELRLDREVLQRDVMKQWKRAVCEDSGSGYCTNEMWKGVLMHQQTREDLIFEKGWSVELSSCMWELHLKSALLYFSL